MIYRIVYYKRNTCDRGEQNESDTFDCIDCRSGNCAVLHNKVQ